MVKRLLSAELKVWHLFLVVALLVIGTGSTSAAQTALFTRVNPNVPPTAFFPNGAFNMAAAQSNTSQTVHQADGEVEILRATFKVPSGQVADIAAFFNAEAYKYPNGYCYVTSYIDTIGGTPLAPGELWVVDGYVYSGAYPTISAQGYKAGVRPGTHSVVVTLHATGGDCFVDDRSLIVISNRHT